MSNITPYLTETARAKVRDFPFPFPIADSPLEIWKHLALALLRDTRL